MSISPRGMNRLWGIASIAAMLIGLAAVAVFHLGRSAFYDEAWMIQFARSSTFSESLAWAVRDKQPVAAGFLGVLYVVAKFAGEHVWPYRLPSVLAGAGLVVMTGWLGNRWCRVPGLCWAVGVVLLACPLFQRYTTEIKQYLPAAAVSVGLVIALELWAKRGGRAAAVAWLALAVGGLLLAFSTWFVVAGTGATMFAVAMWRRDRAAVMQTVWVGAVVAVVGAVLHLSFNRYISGSGLLKEYWADQFLPLDWTWPAAAWRMGASLFEQAWYRYTVPGQIMMGLAIVGWLAWLWREPVAAVGVAGAIGATLAANVAGLWPLGVRINMTLVVLAHLCVLVGPTILAGKLLQVWLGASGDHESSPEAVGTVQGTGSSREIRTFGVLRALGFSATVVLVGATVYESHGADYEVADVDGLLAELVTRARPEDLLLLTTAPYVDQEVRGAALQGEIVAAPWPEAGKMWALYYPLIRGHQRGRVWFAAGHHNPPMALKWSELADKLAGYGRVETVWSGKNVALYVFEPTSWPEMLTIPEENPHTEDPPRFPQRAETR